MAERFYLLVHVIKVYISSKCSLTSSFGLWSLRLVTCYSSYISLHRPSLKLGFLCESKWTAVTGVIKEVGYLSVIETAVIFGSALLLTEAGSLYEFRVAHTLP